MGHNGGTVTQCYSIGRSVGRTTSAGWWGTTDGTIDAVLQHRRGQWHGDFVGGLVGDNGGTVTQCYSTGAVSGGYRHVGGLVG